MSQVIDITGKSQRGIRRGARSAERHIIKPRGARANERRRGRSAVRQIKVGAAWRGAASDRAREQGRSAEQDHCTWTRRAGAGGARKVGAVIRIACKRDVIRLIHLILFSFPGHDRRSALTEDACHLPPRGAVSPISSSALATCRSERVSANVRASAAKRLVGASLRSIRSSN